MLSDLVLENFRGHRRTSVALSRWTILYGGNGAGKSSVLDGLNTVSSFVHGRPADQLFKSGVFSLAEQSTSSSAPIAFELRLSHDDIRYRVEFDSAGATATASELLTVGGRDVLSISSVSTSELLSSRCSDHAAALDIRDSLQFARRYRFEPRELRGISTGYSFVERNGVGLASSLASLSATDPQAYSALIQDFTTLFPDLTSLAAVALPAGGSALVFSTGSSSQLSGVHLSDGQALVLGLLFLGHAPHGPRILLVDEPEVTLSPVVTGELLGMLDRALGNGRQIIATTHSPYVIRWGIENDAEVRQVRPDFGTRSWKECLHQQGIDPSSIHSQTSPIDVGKCCALLETYLTA